MHFAFLIDPLATLKPKKDSSLDLMLEATRRKHRVSIFGYENLSLSNGDPLADATEVSISADVLGSTDATTHVRPLGPSRCVAISSFDAVFIRKDPPFDGNYLALTYILDKAEGRTRFVNSPRGVREISEKLYATRYRNRTPKTLVTWDVSQAWRFVQEHDKAVLKPAFLGSGKGIVLASAQESASFAASMQAIMGMDPRGPVIVQEYLPEASEGDTRVMMLDGVPLAALGRRPAPGEFRANIAAGGAAFALELSESQRSTAVEIGRDLKLNGIVFAGLDFIGDHLIEINVTSPTLIQELRRITGFDMSSRILDLLEATAS